MDKILAAIDAEISRLQKVRSLLGGVTTNQRGRKVAVKTAAPKKRAKRAMSAAARKRIAKAQRKRWARVNAAKKSSK